MNWTNKLKPLVIISLSTIISFLIVEYSYRYIKHEGSFPKGNYKNRTMLFEVGDNFQNFDGYFKYFPNQEIRSTTLYTREKPTSIDDIQIEYDYIIRTNNSGLVMKRDVIPNEHAIFVIGDSFTEGQGASPWFYELEDTYNGPQIINLGILGTGPKQWENLSSSTTQQHGLDVVATVVNIIPEDMYRNVWTFKERELNCLHHASCDYVFGFQGYNFVSKESNDDIKHSVLNSIINAPNISSFSNWKLRNIEDFLKQSHVLLDLSLFLKKYSPEVAAPYSPEVAAKVADNEAAILSLREAVSGNFYVNVVSQKSINSNNYEYNKISKELINFLYENQIKYKWCDIPVDGFHKIDGHPNANGYKILLECTRDALSKLETSMR